MKLAIFFIFFKIEDDLNIVILQISGGEWLQITH